VTLLGGVNAAEFLLEGPGGLVGVVTAEASLFVLGPGELIPAFIAGSMAGNALIRHQPLSPEERALAETVFGNTMPPNDKIILTNLVELGNGPFAAPNLAGKPLVKLRDWYNHPRGNSKLLSDELTHVWQIPHASFVFGLICEGIASQARSFSARMSTSQEVAAGNRGEHSRLTSCAA